MSDTQFSTQTLTQRRNGGGVGRCEQSFIKLETIDSYLRRLLPVLSKRGAGLIIDMHAGDGRETPYPTPDFFSGGKLICTPALALRQTLRYPLEVILCEKDRKTRRQLDAAYGDDATILGDHHALLESHWLDRIRAAHWVIVLNDPNGYRCHGFTVMQAIAQEQRFSDFIVVVNLNSLERVRGVKSTATPGAIGCIRSFEQNGWMMDPQEWRQRLGKRQVLATSLGRLSNAMTAQILLLSNFIPGFKP